MDYYYRVLSNVKYFYNTINPATLSGAIDVIVVEQPNGEYMSTPFHVRFGKYGVFNSTEKYVDISINGKEIDLKMKLGENGVAFFVEKAQSEVPDYLVTSPLPGSQQTDTSKLLTESVKSLERHKNEQKRKRSRSSTAERKDSKDSASTFASGRRLISESSDASPSRSHSPEQRSRCQTLDANTAAELAAERKKTLPFSSSVFSSRPYRSLPDLSRILQEDSDADERQVKEKARRKMTTIEPPKPPGTVPRLRHSKSVVDEVTPGVSKPTRRVRIDVPVSESATTDDVLEGLLSTQTSSQRKLAVSEPIDIKTARGEDSDDEDISSSSSSSPSRREKTTDLADDALSDSEVDRHRNIPAGSDVAEWKWGELPKSRDEQLKEEQEKKKAEEKPKVASSWKDWWWGGRSSKAGPSSNQEPGVYLDEIDSSNLQKYLGKANSTRTDSGNGSSRGATSPNSPNAHSDTEGQGAEQGADKTPTQETINDAVGRIRKKQKDSDEDRVRHASNDGYSSGSDIFPLNEEDDAPLPEDSEPRFIRSLRLDSKKLRDLGLTHGANECRFSITTKFQGTTWCSCYIYLYKWYEKLVISDIDGTITKSDVLGHVIPAIGGTWAHAGVAELYTRIKNNGYRMVYLSSRAIGQSHSTKQYLKSVAQDSKVLPDGPVLLSPTSVLVAFRKEVIERRPEEFKIAALSDLKKLFPTKRPFFAGFGNRETDVISYKAVDIPPERILIIDPSGRVRRADSIGYVSSYASMAEETVDYLFPPLSRKSKLTTEGGLVDKTRASFTRPLKHSSFTHWRDTNPETLEDDELAEYETKRKASMDANKKRKK